MAHVITKDIPADNLAIARSEQTNKTVVQINLKHSSETKKIKQNPEVNRCVAIGILGNHEAAPILVEALKRTEYRGYDSSGIATVESEGSIDRRRAVGNWWNYRISLFSNHLKGKVGLDTPDGQRMESKRKKCTST